MWNIIFLLLCKHPWSIKHNFIFGWNSKHCKMNHSSSRSNSIPNAILHRAPDHETQFPTALYPSRSISGYDSRWENYFTSRLALILVLLNPFALPTSLCARSPRSLSIYRRLRGTINEPLPFFRPRGDRRYARSLDPRISQRTRSLYFLRESPALSQHTYAPCNLVAVSKQQETCVSCQIGYPFARNVSLRGKRLRSGKTSSQVSAKWNNIGAP